MREYVNLWPNAYIMCAAGLHCFIIVLIRVECLTHKHAVRSRAARFHSKIPVVSFLRKKCSGSRVL